MKLEERVELINEVKKQIKDTIDLRKDFSDDEIKELITNIVFEKTGKLYLSISEKKEIIDDVFNSMRRLDILQPIIDDKSVTEIMINGPDTIFIEKNGKTYRLDVRFENRRKLEDVIQTMVSKVNRTVNESSPIVDARLEDGSRVNVVLPPIALNGPIVTIRKFPEKPMTIDQLIEYGSITEEVADVLNRMVRAKYNIFISGGTGSGKTTFLNALSNFIPKDERIITIEDSAELQIIGLDNIVKMETRNANTEGKGEITIRDLIKTSLRMRPERIIVGEVRGPEALDMLQAMNTGHDGSLSTGHANSPKDMLSRLETMVLSGSSMPLEAIRQQIASAIDIIIHLARLRDKTRRTMEITEIAGYENGEIILNPLYVFEEEGETPQKVIIGSLKRTKNEMVRKWKFKMAGISDEF
ncbi:MAG TPA: CpaF family protein [Acetivibrio sp.]|jgi:pilus assembly protein CpaF|nr:CpaF family protein [Clostridium sp.]HOQ36147.1 CpaF family protein [Acetivibrio sp.]HPT90111.1 CpaF family protein [Acetivibrio sp.]HQA58779.1 CpaF family protein [Acetivibrio sp.]